MKLYPLFILSILLTTNNLRAQTDRNTGEAKEGIPVRNLGVCFLNANTTPEIYYRDALGEYQRLRIDTIRFSSWNTIPATTQLQLYKQIPPPPAPPTPNPNAAPPEEAKPTYEPIQTWTLPEGTDSIRKLFYYGSEGKIKQMTFTVDPESHEALEIKVLNLLDVPTLVRVDDKTEVIPPGDQAILNAASSLDERFIYQFAYQTMGEPSFLSPPIKLRFVTPNQRMTVIIGYLPIMDLSNTETPKILRLEANSIRFYEDVTRLPAPPEPVLPPRR